jgi:hypothetical protein
MHLLALGMKTQLIKRFCKDISFVDHITLGVHNFIMKRLYRNLFEKMGQGKRDKQIEQNYANNR